jgi:hypothetical protein
VVGASVLAALGTAWIASGLISVDAAAQVAASLAPLPAVLANLVVLLVSIVMEVLAFVLRPLSEALSEALAERGAMFAATREPLLPPDVTGGSDFPEWLNTVVRGGALVLGALAVAVWLARTVRRYTSQAVDPSFVGRTIEMTPADLAGDLADWFDGLRARVRGAVSARLRREHGVRRLYGDFLARMADLGSPRAEAVTPWEFAPTAAGTLSLSSDVGMLTDAFVRSRYAEREPDPDELNGLTQVAVRIFAAADAVALAKEKRWSRRTPDTSS